MRKKILFILLCLLFCGKASGDYFTEYLWYRALPDENRIVISTELLYGHQAVDAYERDAEALESEGKYQTCDARDRKGPRIVEKEEVLNGHTIRSVLEIAYPRGTGLGGASPHVWAKIYIDGVLRADCPVGGEDRSGIEISRIVICTDPHYLGITATYFEQRSEKGGRVH
jgi:hypothetical protein